MAIVIVFWIFIREWPWEVLGEPHTFELSGISPQLVAFVMDPTGFVQHLQQTERSYDQEILTTWAKEKLEVNNYNNKLPYLQSWSLLHAKNFYCSNQVVEILFPSRRIKKKLITLRY